MARSLIVTIILLFSGNAGILGAASPGWIKVLISKGGSSAIDAGAMQQLRSSGSRQVESYDVFQLIQVPAQAVSALRGTATKLGLTFEERDDLDKIYLPNLTYDARGNLRRTDYAEDTKGLYVIQFIGPAKPIWLDLGRFGIEVLQAVPQNALIVAATPAQVRALETASPFVQWINRYESAAKPALFASTDAPEDLIVQVANVAGRDSAVGVIAAVAVTPPRVEQLGNDYLVHARISGASAAALLDEPLIMGIHREPHLQLSDERQTLNATLTSGTSSPSPGYIGWLASHCAVCSNLNAEGFYVDVADSGVDNGSNYDPGSGIVPHPELAGRESVGTAYNSEVYCPGGPDRRCDRLGHGTLVAGIIAANGATARGDTNGYLLGVGIAPSAGIVNTKIANEAQTAPTGSIFDWAKDSINHFAYVQNHSHNDYPTPGNPSHYVSGQYTLESRNYDFAVRDADNIWANGVTPLTLTVSAGNINQSAGDPVAQLVLPPATAKNVIAVGAAENYRPDKDDKSSACHGTAADSYLNLSQTSKRSVLNPAIFKPDLVAPGTMIVSTKSVSIDPAAGWCDNAPYASPQHLMDSGTSFTAPVAAGAALLAARLYSSTASAATPSLRKAMLIGSARTMKGGIDRYTFGTIGASPNNQVGFGLLSLAPLFSSLGNQYINETVVLRGSGTSWSQDYYPVDQNQPVTVVLVWSDAPAAAGSTNTLVNDLDIEVDAIQGPGGCRFRYSGNQVDSSGNSVWYPCTGTLPRDSANNVEVVRFTPGGFSYPMRIIVRATSVSSGAVPNAGGPSQDFSLYISNAHL